MLRLFALELQLWQQKHLVQKIEVFSFFLIL
jgi:hypothetical protein